MTWLPEIMMMALIITVGIVAFAGAMYGLYQLFGPWFIIAIIIVYGISLTALLRAYQ